jgi:hypothetical protein
VVTFKPKELEVWDAETGSSVVHMQRLGPVGHGATVNADASILVNSRQGLLSFWRLPLNAHLPLAFRHETAVTSAAFTADGAHVLTKESGGQIWRRPLTRGATPTAVADPVPSPSETAAGPNGRYVARVTPTGVDVAAVDAPDEVLSISVFNPVTHVAFGPDGRRLIVAAGRTATVHDLAYFTTPLPFLERAIEGCLPAAYRAAEDAPDGQRRAGVAIGHLGETPAEAAAAEAECRAALIEAAAQ